MVRKKHESIQVHESRNTLVIAVGYLNLTLGFRNGQGFGLQGN